MKADYLAGLKDSLAFDKFLIACKNPNLFKHIKSIIGFNACLYVVPWLLFGNILPTFINVIATAIHVVKYFDLVSVMKDYNSNQAKVYSTEELLSMALLMLIYQLVVQVLVYGISAIFWPLSIPVLLFYHSFYCFNNLWQCQGIPLATRSRRMETMWPYYAGYSTISTVLYLLSNKLLFSGAYNIFFAMNICLVYLTKPYKSDCQYVPINLSIFSYLTRLVVRVVAKILG